MDGSVMFPNIEYNSLTEIFPYLYVITNLNVSGVINTDGRMIIPMEYEKIKNETHNGFLTCYRKSSNGKKAINHCDIYTIHGKKVVSLDFEGNSISACDYDSIYRVLTVSYYVKKKCYRTMYNLDGQLLVEPTKAFKLIPHEDYVTVDNINKKKTIELSNYNYLNHPTLDFDEAYCKDLAEKRLLDNYWIQQAIKYYNEGKWNEAVTFINYYDNFDKLSEIKNTNGSLNIAAIWMNSMYQLGYYQEIANCLARSDLFSYSLSYDKYKKELNLTYQFPVDKGNSQELFASCKKIFDETIEPIIFQNELEEQKRIAAEKEARRQQNAAIWGAVLTGVSNTLVNTMGNNSRSTTNQSHSTTLKSSSMSTTSSTSNSLSSNSSDEYVIVEKKIDCKLCKGSGTCTFCHGVGKKTYGGKYQTCDSCNGSGKCSVCKGKGYSRSTFENVRK